MDGLGLVKCGMMKRGEGWGWKIRIRRKKWLELVVREGGS
jgi:hypothetical protein